MNPARAPGAPERLPARLLRALLPKGRLGRGLALLVGGAAFGQAVVLLVTPLLTRLYTPEDFGVLGVFTALLGIGGTVACLRYELAVLVADDDATAANLTALGAASACVLGLAAGLALAIWGGALARLVGAPRLEPLLWLLPVGLLAVGWYNALNHWAMRRQAFGRIARTRLSQSLGQAMVQLGLGALAVGPVGLLAGQVIGQSAGVASLAAAAYGDGRREGLLARIRPSALRRAARRYHRFPTLATGAALLNSSSRMLPALFVAAIYGPQVAGWFALAQRVLGAPMRLLGNTVAQVYLSEAPKLARVDRGAAYALFMTTTWRLLAVGSACLGVVALAGPVLFAWLFGAGWGEAGRFAQFMALMYLAQLVVSPTSQTLMVFERQGLQLAWDALRLAALAAVFLTAYALQWPPVRTVAVLSAAMAGCYLVMFLLTRLILVTAPAPVDRTGGAG